MGESSSVTVTALIGGHEVAAVSICPASIAESLQLEYTGRTCALVGFNGAKGIGKETRPLQAEVCGYDIELALWVAERPTPVILIGRVELAKRDLAVLARDGKLVARSSLPILAVAAEDVGIAKQPNVVSAIGA